MFCGLFTTLYLCIILFSIYYGLPQYNTTFYYGLLQWILCFNMLCYGKYNNKNDVYLQPTIHDSDVYVHNILIVLKKEYTWTITYEPIRLHLRKPDEKLFKFWFGLNGGVVKVTWRSWRDGQHGGLLRSRRVSRICKRYKMANIIICSLCKRAEHLKHICQFTMYAN